MYFWYNFAFEWELVKACNLTQRPLRVRPSGFVTARTITALFIFLNEMVYFKGAVSASKYAVMVSANFPGTNV